MSGERKTDLEKAMNACYMDSIRCQDGGDRRPHRILGEEVKKLERENAELRSWIAEAAPMYEALVCHLIDTIGITNWPKCMEGCQAILETCPLVRDEWKGGEG
jgi:hypothetical protein